VLKLQGWSTFFRRDLLRNRHVLPEGSVLNPQAISVKGSTMSSKIYVGNLPYTIDDASLRQNFSDFGGVLSAKVMLDRDTGRSKGFAFVEMSSAEEAQAAITGLNGMSVGGRSIVVNISKPKEPSTGYGSGYRDTRN
jgi:RNA recognition motif-containing protein